MANKTLAQRISGIDTLCAKDPDLTAKVEKLAPNVPPANPTKGPHRITFIVPNPDDTIVSFGQAAPVRINDVGITGRTKSHIHWHVYDTAFKTVVTLGSGATTAGGVGAFDATVPTKATGYAMATDGIAWHDSKLQHYIVSREQDVVIRAAKADAILQSDEKKVHITGGHAVSVSAKGNIKIAAEPGIKPEDKKWHQRFEGLVGKLAASEAAKKGMKSLDVATAILALHSTAVGIKKKAKDGKTGWENTDAWDKAKVITDVVKLISQIGRFASDINDDQTGKVGITGATYTSITGGVAAGLYGGLSASLTSILSASILGGTAGVKGLAWASMWAGIGASVKGLKDAGIEGEKGKCTVKGKKEVGITSDGKVTATGKSTVQVNTDGEAYFHAGSSVYLAAGKSNGYGLMTCVNDVFVGKISSAGDFKGASAVSNEGMSVGGKKLLLRFKSSSIDCQESEIRVRTSKLKLNGDNVTVKGSKVLLGD